ncbi:hypothetical protein STIAU_1480 [Stigmatella aurantiaca DW4/3-1]|uniref:Uncharacterized protein n=1 Tax=Stigmatella aurantiaca (strain DW4/3-1) TaxID=378806 RepID=Q09DK4_STIAD|nr:hypothetical protein STIAU_1480 [Stigmatella aurantiaca DW4/3-1]
MGLEVCPPRLEFVSAQQLRVPATADQVPFDAFFSKIEHV